MRIALDFSAVRRPGAENYCRNFLRHLPRFTADDQILLFLPPRMAREQQAHLPANITVRVTGFTANRGLRVLWQQFVLPVLLLRWHADVLYEPHDVVPLASPCPVVVAARNPIPLLDLAGLGYSNWLRLRVAFHRRLIRWSTRRASLVYYPSQYAAQALGTDLGVPPRKRRVVHHGFDHSWWTRPRPLQPILRRYNLPQAPYLLFASQLYRQKHPEVLIRGFARWVQGTGRDTHHVVIAGGPRDRQYPAELRSLAQALGIAERTHFLGLVPPDDLAALYQHAAAFVLPSTMETFGHPYVEAMATGVPLLSADIPIAREICQDGAIYFPPGDSDALATLLEQVVSNTNGLRDRMVACGRARAESFSWEQAVAEGVTLLRSAATTS